MTAWLITGGAGFIGTNFVRMAADNQVATIVVLDALTYAGNLANIADLIDARLVDFHKGDICEVGIIEHLFEAYRFDCVVHFAAESHVDRSILSPQSFLRTNIEGTYVLVEAARRAWQGEAGHRFIHVSTDEVFGDLAPGDPPFAETSPYRPSSPYAASKASADHLVRAWQRTYGLPAIVINSGNNYGPWQFPEKLIPLMILSAIENRELPVYGDGLQVRNWLHVSDHCRAINAVIERGEVGSTYLVGGDSALPNLEVVRRICQAVDAELGRAAGTSEKLIRHVTDRPGHDRRYAVNSSFIRDSLDWHPLEQFEIALPALVRWYLQHKDWADTVRTGAYRRNFERQYKGRILGTMSP
jgi:dTDP-glucose 4,6-dehydratase